MLDAPAQRISVHDEAPLRALFPPSQSLKIYRRLEKAVYREGALSWQECGLPPQTREVLEPVLVFQSLTVIQALTSEDGRTTKLALRAFDGAVIETVLMRHGKGRNTVCVSSQCGCAVGCVFCSTGLLGLTRDLDFTEIVEQVQAASRLLAPEGERVRNVVFMGMGEPLLNYENVKKALSILGDQRRFEIAPSRITVSTCGIVPAIKILAQDFPLVGLALSLHSPDEGLRSQLIPAAKAWPMAELLAALADYEAITGRRVFYEYILIRGVTDTPQMATALLSLLGGRPSHLNLIPYNAGPQNLPVPSRAEVEAFHAQLLAGGLAVTIRHSMGDRITAACGQLGFAARTALVDELPQDKLIQKQADAHNHKAPDDILPVMD